MQVSRQIAPVWRQLKDDGVKTADGLLARLRIVEPPVDLDGVADLLEVAVGYAPTFGKWAGEVSVEDDVARITIAREDHPLRQRFTLAHELGHLMLHDLEEPKHRDYTFVGGWREVQANSFAADLLMPASMVSMAFSGVRRVASLAKMFEVSEQAMTYRLKNLGYIP